VWAGVDVGGRRKGFHVALVDDRRLVGGPWRLARPEDVVEALAPRRPLLVAVDGPRRAAPRGFASRPAEREFAAAGICAIRFTPDARRLRHGRYHEWVRHGLALYRVLEDAGLASVECYPTASWTRWAGPRGRQTRAGWSRRALAACDLRGVPARVGQDGRDAIGAALTARLHAAGGCTLFGGEIAVPS
jgi:predicted nuclease with RNAse H fold